MKMLVASDLHGSLSSLEFLINKLESVKPDLLLLLGDLVYHGPRNPLPQNYDTRAILDNMDRLNRLPCPVCAVRGNCDGEVDLGLLPFHVTEDSWLNIDGMRIYASHGHRLPENGPIRGLPEGTVVMRGHTHIPRGETAGGLHFWNPGSLSLPKGGFPRSYGFYEDGVFHVLDLNDQRILSHKPASLH